MEDTATHVAFTSSYQRKREVGGWTMAVKRGGTWNLLGPHFIGDPVQVPDYIAGHI